jgi:hypothetical protein
MLLTRHQRGGKNYNIEILVRVENMQFENVSQLKCLGKIVIHQNLIQEEIQGKLNSGDACYHSVQYV